MLWPSGIRRRDSNPRPSDHESPPIATRPGLPPSINELFAMNLILKKCIVCAWALPDLIAY